jgi:N-acetylglutamate synthase-like GNAT family acetyltransferase
LSSPVIRPAAEADQKTIKTIVRAARINPTGLNWQRFLVAEHQGLIVGVGQVKPHGDGTRELASIAVIPERQHQGIASALIENLLDRETGTLHLMCRHVHESFYGRFGFRRIEERDMTPYFRRMIRLSKLTAPLGRLMMGEEVRIIIMKRDDGAASGG